jgi:hypothetical protein
MSQQSSAVRAGPCGRAISHSATVSDVKGRREEGSLTRQ